MQISIRELKANPSRAIALANQGQRVQITSHRKVVAELVMPGTSTPATAPAAANDDQRALARLLASGLVAQPATQPLVLGEAVDFMPGPDGQSMSELVLSLRGPR